jgi:hypothetical protein
MNPLITIPYSLHLLAVFASIYSLYRVYQQRNIAKRIRIWVTVVQLWNIILQTVFFVHYTIFLEFAETRERSFSLVWIAETGIVWIIIQTNLSVLQIFESITIIKNERILALRIFFTFLFLSVNVLSVGKLVFGVWRHLWEEEQLVSIGFIGLCMIYDNWQAAYLISILYNRKKSRNTQFDHRFRKTILWAGIIVMLDWVTLGLVIYQMYFVKDQVQYIIQECAGGLSGIHAVGLITMFQNFKKLTFTDKKPKVVVDAPIAVAVTELAPTIAQTRKNDEVL